MSFCLGNELTGHNIPILLAKLEVHPFHFTEKDAFTFLSGSQWFENTQYQP